MNEWMKKEEKLFFRVVERTPVVLVRGEGAYVWDDKGKRYLDFVAGWAVNSLGHCHPVVAGTLAEQGRTLIQVSNQFYTTPQVVLAELLVANSCLQRVFFCNSGAEANEGAVKLARRYGKLRLNGAYEVITTLDSFHGRTLAMVAATGQKKFQEPYTPLPEGFINVPFNDPAAIRKATTTRTCAVMLEPIQGEGGVNVPADDYLREVRRFCDEKGILLILDEVQTGIGRTGSLFAYQQSGAEPDIMTLAKGLASGLPLGAVLAKEKAAVFAPGEHGSTLSGNPLVSAVGVAVMKFILENDVVAQVQKVGHYFREALDRLKDKFDFITDVRGRGLLLAVQFDRDIAAGIAKGCLDRGLLVNRVKPDVLRFMPPLIITKKEVDEAMNIIEEVLTTWQRK